MRLRRVEVLRLPGIDEPFVLPGDVPASGDGAPDPDPGPELDAGVHVIVGPNAIGKSSLCRAVESLLWSEAGPGTEIWRGGSDDPPPPFRVRAELEIDGVRWWAERDGPVLRWQREGVESPPPPLPPAHLRGCFFLGLRELLELSRQAGQDVAAAIRRQLAGGFDLGAIERELRDAVRPGADRHARGQVEACSREIGKAVRKQRELAGREEGLARLEERLGEAEAARRRGEHVATARDLLDLREKLASVEAELAALPPALEGLGGGEAEDVAAREEKLEERRREREEAEGQRASAARAAAEAGLAAPAAPAELQALEVRGQQLARLETELEAAARERRQREAVLARARRDLGAREDLAESEAELDPAAVASLLELLRRAAHCDARRGAVETRLALLAGAPGPEEERRRDLLRRGVERLRAWLRSPEPLALAGAAGKPWVLPGALLLALAGGLLALFDLLALSGGGGAPGLVGALLAGLGGGLTAGLLLIRRAGEAGAAARAAARREYPAALPPPAAWERGEVAERLAELEDELAGLEARIQQAEYRKAERADLEQERQHWEGERQALDARRSELARGLGLQALPEAELADLVGRLAALREARREAAGAGARESALAERRDALLAELGGALGAHGLPAPGDAAAAHAGVSDLRSRSEALARAREREATQAARVRRLDAEIAQLREERAEVYRRAGLEVGDRAGLGRLLGDLGRYRDLRKRREELRLRRDGEMQRLEAAAAADLAERSPGELETEAEELRRLAAEAGPLRDEIAEIRSQVRQARAGRTLEEVLAGHAAALAALRERRDARLRAEAGCFLLSEVEREHETIQQPRVLERARQLFADFTQHRYALRVAPDGAQSFVARETATGAGLRPDQLSDGTRAQLVLAARLAFAEEAEAEAGPGVRLPIFLDEALDHSDPERFEAIARSLGRMARRQLFYLTTDPADAERLGRALAAEGCPPPRVIDLAAARRRAASVPGPGALRVPPLPVPPSPDGHDAGSYGAALGVPPLDPARGAAAQHLLHLLWDDLPLLHRLLREGIERVGAWTHLAGEEAPRVRELRKAGGAGGELDARAELLEAFCEAWQVGRGRPVDREVLVQSRAVTDTFMDRVVAVARDLGGDAGRLMEALRERSDERLSGFRSRAAEQLEEFLLAEGHLDPRAPLSPGEIQARLLALPAAARLPEGRVAECCHRWMRLAGCAPASGQVGAAGARGLEEASDPADTAAPRGLEAATGTEKTEGAEAEEGTG